MSDSGHLLYELLNWLLTLCLYLMCIFKLTFRGKWNGTNEIGFWNWTLNSLFEIQFCTMVKQQNPDRFPHGLPLFSHPLFKAQPHQRECCEMVWILLSGGKWTIFDQACKQAISETVNRYCIYNTFFHTS